MKRSVPILLMSLLVGSISVSINGQSIVTNGNNSGEGSLREAILNAQENTTISFQGVDEVVLDEEIKIIPNNLIIDGGDNKVKVRLKDESVSTSRLFYIDNSGESSIHLKNIHLTGGQMRILSNKDAEQNEVGEIKNDCNGGAIFIDNEDNTLYLENVTIEKSVAPNGGAIYTKGHVAAIHSAFMENFAEGTGNKTSNGEDPFLSISMEVFARGGAICAWGNITIHEGCRFEKNNVWIELSQYDVYGGALYAGGDITITGTKEDTVLFQDNFLKASASDPYRATTRAHINGLQFRSYGGAVCALGSVNISYTYFIENGTNLKSIGYTGSGSGGAVYSARDMVVTHCSFEGNYGHRGGALFSHYGTMNVQASTFKRNQSSSGGAIASFGAVTTIDECSFGEDGIEESGNNGNTGGAISIYYTIDHSSLTIKKSYFYHNKALDQGGAIAVYSGYPNDVKEKFQLNIINSHFMDNSVDRTQYNPDEKTNGGAISIYYSNDIEINIEDGSTFKNNRASGSGTIYLRSFNKDINMNIDPDVRFTGNNVGSKGGAICLISDYGAVTGAFQGVSFEDNTAAEQGGAFYIFNNKTFEITDCTFDGNTAQEHAGAFYLYNYINENSTAIINGKTVFSNNQAGKKGGAIYTYYSNSLIVEGETSFSGNNANEGGAIYSDNNTSLTIQEKISFSGNTAKNDGGAIYKNSGELTIQEKISFTGNSANKGGAIYANDVNDFIVSGGDAADEKIIFTDNKSTDNGGSILLWMGKASLSNAIFTSTSTDLTDYNAANGGAIYSAATLNLHNITTSNLKAQYSGGAIFRYFYDTKITNSTFINNQANYEGGAIANTKDYGSLYLTNCLLAKNTSGSLGGGLYNEDSKDTYAMLLNCTVVDNQGSYGGGIMNNGSAITHIYNTIVWGNKAGAENQEDNSWGGNYQHSLVEGKNLGGNNLDGTDPGNVPHFMGSRSYYDSTRMPYYGLADGSPGVDAGLDKHFQDLAGNNLTTDLLGASRFKGICIDMGAYEQSANIASFVENTLACEGSSGSLKIKLRGEGPWKINYKIDGGDQEKSIDIPVDKVDAEGIYILSGLSPAKYILTTVEGLDGSGVLGSVTEATIHTVSYPSVSPIEGPSEVQVDSTLVLTNATSGGIWLVDKPEIATIDLRGTLTALAEGVVEVWYVVTGSSPTHCETIVIHPVTVKAKGNNGGSNPDPDPEPEPTPEDPDPEWPPVVPEPDPEPDPDPDAWVIIRPGTIACHSDALFNITFRLQYTSKPLKYAIAFTEASKATGFQDVKAYKELPADGMVSIAIPQNVKPGQYSGYLLVRETGSTDYKMYAFTFTINGDVVITRQPRSVTMQGDGEHFRLTVEAEGDNLRYQWFYNGERIQGATSQTYEEIYDNSKEGLYYVEVYSDCGWIQSEEATVTGCFGILIKWEDVLYVQNTEGRYVRFQWYRNGEAIGTYGTSIYYTDPKGLEGSYYVRAYLADGTYHQSCVMTFQTSTRSTTINVYPTAVERSHYINVESDERGDSYIGGYVELYNLSGGKVYTQRLSSSQIRIAVNQPAGTYILVVTAPGGRQKSEKIMVK